MSGTLKIHLEDKDKIEGIDYWSIGLYESADMTVTKNLGVQNLWISKYIVEVNDNKKEVYAVEIETNAELVNWNDGEKKVLNEIVENPTYDMGEFEIADAFYSFDAAYEYAKKNYPKGNLAELIKAHYAE